MTIQPSNEPTSHFNQSGQTVHGPQSNIIGNVYTGDQAYDVRGLANPYLGLKAFTYAERTRYAGRDAEIARALTLLTTPGNERTLLFVTGASGSGKSSFAQAGLLPELKLHYPQDTPVSWATFRPGEKPLAALAGALRALKLPVSGLFAPAAPYQLAPPASLAPANQLSLLLIDQFEELFSQSDAAERDAIFTLLAHLPPFRDLHMHIIATLRADYLPDLFAHPVLYDQAKAGIDLRVMDARQIELAIQRPLQVLHPQADKRFQTALLNRLAADAAEDAAYLPLLQVTLEELWRNGFLTIDYYISLTGAISQRADAIFTYTSDAAGNPTSRSPQQQATLLQIFLDLVDVSPDGDQRGDVRRTQRLADLTRGQLATESLIRELATARLLSTGEKPLDPGGQPTQTVDIIHESLIQNWARLQQAIQTKREHLQQRRRFELRLAEWRSHDQSPDYLLNGVYLAEAEQLQQSDDIVLQSPTAQAYLAQSIDQRNRLQQAEIERQRAEIERQRTLTTEQIKRTEAEANRARTFRWATIITISLFVIALAAAGLAINRQGVAQSNAATAQAESTRAAQAAKQAINAANSAESKAAEARRALSIQLASQSMIAATQESDPSIGLILARDSLERTYRSDGYITAEAVNAAYVALNASPTWLGNLPSHRHDHRINSVHFSPDGQTLVTSGYDESARIWRVKDGHQLTVLLGHSAEVHLALFNPAGTKILTVSSDNTAKLWDAQSGRELQTLAGHDCNENSFCAVVTAAYDPPGTRIATGGVDGRIIIWDADSGAKLLTIDAHTERVNSLKFSPDGKFILSAGWDKTAKLWDVHSGRQILSLEGHTQLVNSAIFTPDGSKILTGSNDNKLNLWDAHSGHLLNSLIPLDKYFVSVIANGPKPNQIFALSNDTGLIQLWDIDQQKVITKFNAGFLPTSLDYNAQRNLLAVSGADGTFKVWDVASQQLLLSPPGWGCGYLQSCEAYSVAISPNGKQLVAGYMEKRVVIWDIAQATVIRELIGHGCGVEVCAIRSVTYSSVGDRILTASDDGTAKVWDANTGQELLSLKAHEGGVMAARFSPDGSLIATAGEDGSAKLWLSTTGKLIKTFVNHQARFQSVDFNADATKLLTANNTGIVQLWDIKSTNVITEFKGHSCVDFNSSVISYTDCTVNDAVFSPQGGYFATGGTDGYVKIWPIAGGEPLSINAHSKRVTSVQYSPDGHILLSTGWDGMTRLWDATTGSPVGSLAKHDFGVNGAAFLNDGKTIATVGTDGLIKLWNIAKPDYRLSYVGHHSEIRSLQVSPNGRLIASAAGDPSDYAVKLWNASTGELVRLLNGHSCEVSIRCGASSLAFSPDGVQLATGGQDGKILLWNISTAETLTVTDNIGSPINAIAYSPDGLLIAAGTDGGKLYILETHTGRTRWVLSEHTCDSTYPPDCAVIAVAFSPTGQYVVTGETGGIVRVWNIQSGKVAFVLNAHQNDVTAVQYSPNGAYIVTASEDGLAKIWHADTGLAVTTLSANHGSINTVAFSPDSAYLALAGYDGTIKLLKTAGWQMLAEYYGSKTDITATRVEPDSSLTITMTTGPEQYASSVTALTYDPQGKYLVAGSAHGEIRTWYSTPETLLALLAERIQRDPPTLLLAERQKYGLK